MSDVLARILAYKREEVAARRAAKPLERLRGEIAVQTPPRGFEAALRAKASAGVPALIAEIKKASPSKGLIRADFDPPAHARDYAAGGAACLSVLTDGPSFQGGEADLRAARAAVSLPVLRKDFTIDPYQIVEARALGADAILIILAAVDDALAADLLAAAREFGLDALVETHDAHEAARAVALGASLIGVNNRSLRTFETRLETTEAIAPAIPADRLIVAESGIRDRADIDRLAAAGACAFLVGESLMRQSDLAGATAVLLAERP